MPLALMNSVWITPTPFPVAVIGGEFVLPSSQVASVFVVSRLSIYGSQAYINLDGVIPSSSNFDLILQPGQYNFVVNPLTLAIYAPGASYQIGYETNLIDFYLKWWAVYKTFTAAPPVSSLLDITLASIETSVYTTQVIVGGTGNVYVTLDGRTASSSSYDFILTSTGVYGIPDTTIFNVSPSKIQICGDAGSTIKYGFWEYPKITPATYNTPVYDRGPYPI